ncbi:hypothetical protein AAEH73_21550, partial [Shewanella algae]|uniref:hypothetical protein n=1 Tax=Shewanella algae TaxID=38313 RepID=UPI00313EA203
MAKNLTARGYQSIIEPLLFITPCSSPQPEIENIQAVMATSRHAFDFLDPAIAQTSGLFGRP